MLVGISNDQIHAWQRHDLLRRALRIATGYDDSGLWILAAYTPDRGTRVLIGSGGHGARIQHDNRSLRGRDCARISLLLELAFKGCAIRLGCAAAEVFYKESGHTLCYRTAVLAMRTGTRVQAETWVLRA